MKLEELFPESAQVLDLKAGDMEGVIRELLDHLVKSGRLASEAGRQAATLLLDRERQASTGIGRGLAVPHMKNCDFLEGIVGVFGRSLRGVPFNSVDGDPVRVVFLVLSSRGYADQHLAVVKRVARLGRDDKSLRFLATTMKPQSIAEIFREIDES
jgi:mannitol/fructose-specific phosphotransferase system IIA component (Ntr-type)